MAESVVAILRELLLTEFSESELSALCRDLNIDYAKLEGQNIFGKTRSLIATARERGKFDKLIGRVRDLRMQAFVASGLPAALAREWHTPSTVGARVFEARSARQRENRIKALIVGGAVLGGVVLLWDAAMLLMNRQLPSEAGRPTTQVAITKPVAIAAAPTTTAVAATATTIVRTTKPPTPTTAPDTATPPATENPPTATSLPPTSLPEPTLTSAPTLLLTQNATLEAVAFARAQDGASQRPVIQSDTELGNDQPDNREVIISDDLDTAEQAVENLNALLVGYYQGRVSLSDLDKRMSPAAVAGIKQFDRKISPVLGVTSTSRGSIQATVKYVSKPKVVTKTDKQAVVTTTERWQYKSVKTGKVACETRDYTYSATNDSGKWKVMDFKGKLVATGCAAKPAK